MGAQQRGRAAPPGSEALQLFVYLGAMRGGTGGRRVHAVVRVHPDIEAVRSAAAFESNPQRRSGVGGEQGAGSEAVANIELR